ncbi:cytoplasmic tRNA 2-thiolation protein 2 [Scheffersomyces coipomensis]|uniref:cytoplasmic tRNA 2-thiolation protein 2 n=1 Tax=Scheffersomyces coipomensis TaxID=1788519 RepID=UPI00315C5B71
MSDNQPVKYLDEEESSSSPCQRCKVENAILITRKEKFCQNCFIRFIRGKQRKQMQDDKYKVKYGPFIERHGQQKVLLALSGGESSVVLLDVMASLLQEQFEAHNGKQGFELIILNLDEFDLNHLNKKVGEILPLLIKRYSPANIQYKVLALNSYILDDSILDKIVLNDDFTGLSSTIIGSDKSYTLFDILELCPNKSSVEDLLTIIYNELILRTAYLEKCQTIIYGHSMTRIANEIIALTVKGRGSIIYEAISDHSKTYKDQQFQILFPLRDVLYAEIISYCKLTNMDEFILQSTIPKSKINKNLTIRDLTTRYFSQLDATGYASTASTVVKTGEKLGAPKSDSTSLVTHCQVCGVEIYQDPGNWLRNITVNKAAPIETEEEKEYLESYKASIGEPEIIDDRYKSVHICYGCIVTLGGVNSVSGFVWPLKDKNTDHFESQPYLVDSEVEKQKILDEFILTNDEDEDDDNE